MLVCILPDCFEIEDGLVTLQGKQLFKKGGNYGSFLYNFYFGYIRFYGCLSVCFILRRLKIKFSNPNNSTMDRERL